jgi:hypothetical protein
MFKATEKSIDLTKRLRTPPQRIAPPSKTKKGKGKKKLPPGWVIPGFLTGMTIGSQILIEESEKPIMPSAEDIMAALPRIGEEIIKRFNMAREGRLPYYDELCR